MTCRHGNGKTLNTLHFKRTGYTTRMFTCTCVSTGTMLLCADVCRKAIKHYLCIGGPTRESSSTRTTRHPFLPILCPQPRQCHRACCSFAHHMTKFMKAADILSTIVLRGGQEFASFTGAPRRQDVNYIACYTRGPWVQSRP